MTNTNNKCKQMNCTHSESFFNRYEIVNDKVVLKHGQKWHFCSTCDKVVHLNWIHWHEMKCKSFHETAKNCIAKGHYVNKVHSEGIACNM